MSDAAAIRAAAARALAERSGWRGGAASPTSSTAVAPKRPSPARPDPSPQSERDRPVDGLRPTGDGGRVPASRPAATAGQGAASATADAGTALDVGTSRDAHRPETAPASGAPSSKNPPEREARAALQPFDGSGTGPEGATSASSPLGGEGRDEGAERPERRRALDPAAARPILETRDLARTFGGGGLFAKRAPVRAVDGVTLSIRTGETFAIVGESGCGKSTLARMLIRLIEPSAGQVLYGGRDMSHLPEREMRALRRDLQFIFQDPYGSLNPRMSVGALVEEPMRVHGLGSQSERKAEVRRLLSRVGLRPEHADRFPHEFSGGQRQRIGIARALASRPKVLIGDEPVSALDVSVQAQVVNLLESLKDEFGLTLVIIAHDLAVIRHMADRVAVMYFGEIVEEGPVEAVFESPRHPYTRALLAAIPRPEIFGATRGTALVEGEPPNPVNPPPGCRFHPRCPMARDRCREERPVPLAAGEGRRSACHFWRELADAAPAAAAASRPPALERRLALYRARSAEPEPENV